VEALNVDAPLPRRWTRIRLPIDFRLLYMLPKAAYKTITAQLSEDAFVISQQSTEN
jgi:hypothetical protein